jgi:pimeloyl-ACP methyl ester carboxylesterase
VLAHGFAGSARNFRAQVRGLSADYRVLTYDARGHARSPAPLDSIAYSMDILVSDLLALLDGEGMSEPVVVGGLSMGAATALHFALAHPNRVRALVLASYPPGSEDPGGFSIHAEAFAQEIEENGLEAAGERFVWGSDSGLSPDMAAQVRAGFLEHTAQGLSGVLRGVIAKNVDPAALAKPLARTGLPVLLVNGEQDPPAVRASRILAQGNPDIESLTLPDAGHVVNLAQPRLFNAGLLTFLRRLSPARRLS